MRIGELAAKAGCAVETVRYYEREGLLAAPVRSAGNYRIYDDQHLQRLRFVRNCRNLDMTGEEIRQLLALQERPQQGCVGVNELVEEHIRHVQARIASLQTLEQHLLELRGACAQPEAVEACAIIRQLCQEDVATVGPASHLGDSHGH